MAMRFKVYSGTGAAPFPGPGVPRDGTGTTSPSAGGPVDGVTGGSGSDGSANFQQGWVGRVDCGGSFSAGTALATDGNGRAVAASAGDVVVARALQSSSGAGDTAWVTWDRRTL